MHDIVTAASPPVHLDGGVHVTNAGNGTGMSAKPTTAPPAAFDAVQRAVASEAFEYAMVQEFRADKRAWAMAEAAGDAAALRVFEKILASEAPLPSPDATTSRPTSTHRCYMCKQAYDVSQTFGEWERDTHGAHGNLCFSCGLFNYECCKESTDMSGWTVLLTGCRHTVGLATALRLLRMGAAVIGTTRFPGAALVNFASEPDYETWRDRLTVIECDFTVQAHLDALLAVVAVRVPDVFILNAFMTVEQTPAYLEGMRVVEHIMDVPVVDTHVDTIATASLSIVNSTVLPSLLTAPITDQSAMLTPLSLPDGACCEVFTTPQAGTPMRHAMRERDATPTYNTSSSISVPTMMPFSADRKEAESPASPSLTPLPTDTTPLLPLSTASSTVHAWDASSLIPAVVTERCGVAKSWLSTRGYTLNEFGNLAEPTHRQTLWRETIDDTSLARIAETMRINTIAPLQLLQGVRRAMAGSETCRRVLIHVTSTEHLHATDERVITGMQKAAMENVWEKMAHEKGSRRSFVYSVDPGFVTGVVGIQRKPLLADDGAARVLLPLIRHAQGLTVSRQVMVWKDFQPYKVVHHPNAAGPASIHSCHTYRYESFQRQVVTQAGRRRGGKPVPPPAGVMS